MNRYTFKILPAMFAAHDTLVYDEISNKRLNERTDAIKIIIIDKHIKEAFEKAKVEFSQLIPYNFADIPNIEYYTFRLRVIEIQNISGTT